MAKKQNKCKPPVPPGDGRDDCGWDVFALQYRVDGPLGTLFPATCGARYRALFAQLWRVKRIEYSLHDAWRAHTILQKRLRYMPGQWLPTEPIRTYI